MCIRDRDTTSLAPHLVNDLAGVHIVDISTGDSHCLALTHDCEVFAWGNNVMGQCGQGHSTSPVTPVSYTHLDVYKRQVYNLLIGMAFTLKDLLEYLYKFSYFRVYHI